MEILPTNFSTEHKQMLSHLQVLVTKGYLAIPQQNDKLITSLRTTYAKQLSLVKEETSYDDSLDALRLGLKVHEIN
jgi:hypothetical protein